MRGEKLVELWKSSIKFAQAFSKLVVHVYRKFLSSRKWGTVITEAAILALFLIIALMAVLVRNVPAPAETGGIISAEEFARQGDQLYEAGRAKFNEAALRYWGAVKRNPDIADAHIKLADIYYEYLWNYEALRQLNEVERINPEYPGLHLLMGKIYNRIGEGDKAFESLRKATTLTPEDSEAHYYLGTIYEQQNMVQEAIREYEMAVKSRSEREATVNSYLQLGRIYKGKSDRERAKRELREALSIDPASADAISELRGLYEDEAEDYESKNNFDKAAEKYREIVKMDPDNPRNVEIYMKLGNIYRSKELYDEAFIMYEAAVKLDPANFDAFGALKELELLRNKDKK